MITVTPTGDGDPLQFDVIVRDENRNLISRATCERLSGGQHEPERCIEPAFRFLLDREPKESILRRFDVTVTSRYFPEFEQQLAAYFSRI